MTPKKEWTAEDKLNMRDWIALHGHPDSLKPKAPTPTPTTGWTHTIEFLSAEREATTGKYIIRDAGGDYIAKVEGLERAKLVAAAYDMAVALKLDQAYLWAAVEVCRSNGLEATADALEALRTTGQAALKKAGVL